MTRRRLHLEPAVAALAALAVAAGLVLLSACAGGGSDDAAPPAETGAAQVEDGGLERCTALSDDFARACYVEELKAVVDEAAEPAAALEEIAVAAYATDDGFLLDRPEEPVASGADIEALCAGLDGLQRQACVTGASVVGPVDPRAQLSVCTEFQGEDVLSCIRGTKVQNLITSPGEELVALLRQCDSFPGATGLECHRWLGKVLTVLTNGEFEQLGCPAASSERARRACVEGARASDEALETFS